jgi:hypothetical protein
LGATKGTIVEVPNVNKKAGDGLSNLLNDRVEDEGEHQRTKGITLLNTTATGYGLVVKEEVGLRAIRAFHPGRNGGNSGPHFGQFQAIKFRMSSGIGGSFCSWEHGGPVYWIEGIWEVHKESEPVIGWDAGAFVDIRDWVEDGFTAGKEANPHLQRGKNLQSIRENRPGSALGSKHLPNRDRPQTTTLC